jgi:predicted nucleic-acid-binding protein
MKALDTNVLVRFLVKDDEHQADIVYKLLKKAEIDKDTFYVPLLVVLETIWVLESVYEISRPDILDSIHALVLMPILDFEAQSAILSFISSARNNKMDLPDLLIAHTTKSAGCECVLTFDKQAADYTLFKLLK